MLFVDNNMDALGVFAARSLVIISRPIQWANKGSLLWVYVHVPVVYNIMYTLMTKYVVWPC